MLQIYIQILFSPIAFNPVLMLMIPFILHVTLTSRKPNANGKWIGLELGLGEKITVPYQKLNTTTIKIKLQRKIIRW